MLYNIGLKVFMEKRVKRHDSFKKCIPLYKILTMLNAVLSGGKAKFGLGGIRSGVERAGVKLGLA